ncbi:MAG: MGH1-like glycoside hydrolase domain-containing protein [Vicinamibacteraceae bacterium]
MSIACRGILLVCLLAPSLGAQPRSSMLVLDAASFRHHVDLFNRMAPEEVTNAIPNREAWEWMQANIPFFACPDRDLERIYYYRWWALRKHVTRTPAGWILTEFLKPVSHASDYNAISSALGHHIEEGRWLRDPQYIKQYVRFWLQSGENGGLQRDYHKYSSWAAAAIYDWWLVNRDDGYVTSLLDSLTADYRTWERERLTSSGLFWQFDVRDAMEESVSGSRTKKNLRPTINSYMYGNARAIAAIARLDRDEATARAYEAKAEDLKRLVQDRLWDSTHRFFKARVEGNGLADVRELIGYTPWYFGLPDADRGYEIAWKQLMDPEGFFAPCGPTTAEQRHPGFRIADTGDDCQWNGPSWPFSTTVTLKALANVLHDYPQSAISKADYWKTLRIYATCQRLRLPDGRRIPWIDENLNPFTGEWQARRMKLRKGTFYGRGNHYNHSAFADLVISGLVGLRPGPDDRVDVSPLVPEDLWDWFCLDNVRYHGRNLTILWDRHGTKFGRGKGLQVFADGRVIASARSLQPVSGQLP